MQKGSGKPIEERRGTCSVTECGRIADGAKGLCRKHYMRQYRRGGDPGVLLPHRGNFSTPLSTRTHMFKKRNSGCWEWQGHRNKKGYGATAVKGVYKLAHRAMYEELVGPIPEGLTLDHLCGNTGCVNPEHLDPCTPAENYFRGGRPHFEA